MASRIASVCSIGSLQFQSDRFGFFNRIASVPIGSLRFLQSDCLRSNRIASVPIGSLRFGPAGHPCTDDGKGAHTFPGTPGTRNPFS
eukprot:747834-Prorocentrum_minimum.AAC.2